MLQALMEASQGTLGDVCLPAHLPSGLPAVPKVSSCALLNMWLCCRKLLRPGVLARHHKKCDEHAPAIAQSHMLPGLLLPTLTLFRHRYIE